MQIKDLSLATLENFLLNDLKNGVTLETFREMFFAVRDLGKDHFLPQIDKAYTVAQLKKKVWSYSDAKKSELVGKYWSALIGCFHVFDGAYTSETAEWSSGGMKVTKTHLQTLEEFVNKTTQADLDAYAARYAAKRDAIKKTMTDPETLEEFQKFIQVKGRSALSAAQALRYDELSAAEALKQQRLEAEKRATVSARVEEGLTGKLVETRHTKNGYDLFVVMLSQRVAADVYKSLNDAARRLGGWYSSFTGGGAVPGFQFKVKANAEEFLVVVNGGSTDGRARAEQKEEERKERKKNKFLDMAERLRDAGNESLSRDRKANTSRRARMAESAENDAQNKIFWAGILETLAARLESGTLQYLAGVTALTQLQVLNSALQNAHYRRMRAENANSWDDQPFEFENSLPFAGRPFVTLRRDTVLDLARAGYRIPGQKMRSDNLEKIAKKSSAEEISFSSFEGIETLANLTDHWGVQHEVERVKRLHAAGITTDPLYRMALREFWEIKSNTGILTSEQKRVLKNREIERAFVGRYIDGFFPTPPDLISRMLENVELFEGCRILEPSAGLGHIVCAVSEACPGALIDWCEVHTGLFAAIQAREIPNAAPVGRDFLEMSPEAVYDVILMNPPFERWADETHVQHAYKFLKPGGTLVSIMANRIGQHREFFKWLESVGGSIEANEPGAFKSAFRPTSVNTVTVTITK